MEYTLCVCVIIKITIIINATKCQAKSGLQRKILCTQTTRMQVLEPELDVGSVNNTLCISSHKLHKWRQSEKSAGESYRASEPVWRTARNKCSLSTWPSEPLAAIRAISAAGVPYGCAGSSLHNRGEAAAIASSAQAPPELPESDDDGDCARLDRHFSPVPSASPEREVIRTGASSDFFERVHGESERKHAPVSSNTPRGMHGSKLAVIAMDLAWPMRAEYSWVSQRGCRGFEP